MATTATLTLTSADIAGDPVNVSKTATLTKAGGTTDMDQSTGLNRVHLRETTNVVLLGAVAGGNDLGAKVYIINKATDPTYYIDVDIHDTNIGRLYAGDWLFIPWGINDVASEIVIEAEPSGATCPYEFALFQEPQTLVAHS